MLRNWARFTKRRSVWTTTVRDRTRQSKNALRRWPNVRNSHWLPSTKIFFKVKQTAKIDPTPKIKLTFKIFNQFRWASRKLLKIGFWRLWKEKWKGKLWMKTTKTDCLDLSRRLWNLWIICQRWWLTPTAPQNNPPTKGLTPRYRQPWNGWTPFPPAHWALWRRTPSGPNSRRSWRRWKQIIPTWPGPSSKTRKPTRNWIFRAIS